MDLEEKKKRTETKALSKVRPNNEPDRLRLGMPVVGYSLSLPLSTACRAELATIIPPHPRLALRLRNRQLERDSKPRLGTGILSNFISLDRSVIIEVIFILTLWGG